MNLKVYIDGSEITSKYGAIVMQNGLNALRKPVPMKNPLSNRNAGIDGSRVLYKTLRMDSRTFNLPIAIRARGEGAYASAVDSLISDIQKKKVTLKVVIDGSTFYYRVYYTGTASYTAFNGKWGELTLSFTEPDPSDRNETAK